MGARQNVAFVSRREIFRRLENVTNVASLSPEERWVYEADLKLARDYNAELKGARILGREEGLEEGKKEGMAIGLAEGRAEGKAEGEEIMKERMIEEMRKLGIDEKMISRLSNI